MKRGDIYLVSLDPTAGHEQSGGHPVLVVSPSEFNEATRLLVILPITSSGELGRRLGFAVAVTGVKTTGVVRCDQPRVIDLAGRHACKVDTLPEPIMDDAQREFQLCGAERFLRSKEKGFASLQTL